NRPEVPLHIGSNGSILPTYCCFHSENDRFNRKMKHREREATDVARAHHSVNSNGAE
uniref:Uncharacterized protein n=1 Tax=Anopheles minimus TaxID=112268 RepID=A0A182WMY8_9DIPT